jgi:signal transduction histidine kinase
MSELADLIEEQRAELIDRWEKRLRARLAVTAGMPRNELLDSIPFFLDDLTSTLRASTDVPPEGTATASEHGEHRFRLGFDAVEVVREYGLLAECILDLADASAVQVSRRDQRLLALFILNGTSKSVERYVHHRDEQLRHHTSEHMAFLAHELRNPLGSALAAAALLREPTQDRGRVLDVLDRNLANVRDRVDRSLADLRSQGKLAAVTETIRLHDFFSDLTTEIAADAEHRQISITLDIEESLELTADPRLLGSALGNLLRNAVKFTRQGGAIFVRARLGIDRVTIEVEDGCGGLPVRAAEKIFDPFVQMGTDRTGFGLGLAIAKQAVDAHHGTIKVHDLPGNGCVFVLELPVNLANVPAPAPRAMP